MTDIFTRWDYLKANLGDRDVAWAAHRRYWSQFVTDATVAAVGRWFGQRLIDSDDRAFNDIPIAEWDQRIGIGSGPRQGTSRSEYGIRFGEWFPFAKRIEELSGAKGYSASDLMCIAKEAGRQWVEQQQQEE